MSEKISIVFDGIHWYTSGARNDDLYWALGHIDRVVNLHLDDASPFKTALEQWDRERALPNTTGAIDSTRIVKMFHERGYEGHFAQKRRGLGNHAGAPSPYLRQKSPYPLALPPYSSE